MEANIDNNGSVDFAIGIGGAAGQGIATPGNILARLFARRGLSLNAYNAGNLSVYH